MQHLPPWMRHKTRLFAAIVITLGVLIVAWNWLWRAPAPPAAEEPAIQSLLEAAPEAELAGPTQTPDQAQIADSVIVYVSGAVRAPDVYQLPAAARIKDLVLAAGGLAEDADPEQINLAERLADGQHIHVPRQGETPAVDSASAEGAADATTEQSDLININTASATELDGLPGIGQSFAQRIVEYRTANGAFESVDDLRNVKGIGPALFAKIAPLVTVGP
jgi:competence protein ComEA